MKGPRHRAWLDVRRQWVCPNCRTVCHLGNEIVAVPCGCTSPATWMTIAWERTGRLPPQFVRLPERIPNNFRPSGVSPSSDGSFDQKGELSWEEDPQQDVTDSDSGQREPRRDTYDSERRNESRPSAPDPFFDDSEMTPENS